MSLRPLLQACAAVALVIVASIPASAAPMDRKVVHGTACQPYGPDTVAAELQYSPGGVYNPGTTIEKVICPMPRDQEVPYLAGNVTVVVYYRGFASVDQRLVCTLTVGSTSMQSQAVTTVTVNGPLVKNGARGQLFLENAVQNSGTIATVPNSVVCALAPKSSLGALFIGETGGTHVA